MSDLEYFHQLKSHLKSTCHAKFTLTKSDELELVYFIQEILCPDYLHNFKALLKLHGIHITEADFSQNASIIRWYLDKIRIKPPTADIAMIYDLSF